VAPVYEHLPEVDRIRIYDAAGRHQGPAGILRLCRELRAEFFDVGISIQNAFEAALILYLSGIPIRIGYATDGRSALLTHRVYRRRNFRNLHQIDYYLRLVNGVGIPSCGRNPVLVVSPEETRWADAFLSSVGAGGREVFGINPGAAFGTAKRWFPERFAELCRRLDLDGSRMFLIFGSGSEAALGEKIRTHVGKECLNLCGRTSLRQAFALIQRCRLFVTNDSGLMHAAAALDVPLVAIFGPTRLSTAPFGDASRLVQVPVSCGPCMKPHCALGHRCMEAVTVDGVLSKANDLLSRNP
jgi:heptosyltransferase-2